MFTNATKTLIRIAALGLAVSMAAAPAMAETGAAVRSINGFALHAAWRMAADSNENLFFSPYSVISALGMTYAGARNATAREMESALLFSEGLHSSLGELTKDLTAAMNGRDGAPLLTSANRIWMKEGLGLSAGFAETLCRDYGSSIKELDFKGNPERARRTINRWVEEHTNDRIRDLLRKVEPDAMMILTNAVYFNARWLEPFSGRRTSREPFYPSYEASARSTEVPMMKKNARLEYGQAVNVKLVKIPYNGGISMLVAMPVPSFDRKHKGVPLVLRDVLGSLAGANGLRTFESWVGTLRMSDVDLWLPRFRTERRYELNDLLSSLGVKLAFSDRADFSGITRDENLKIDSVIHQTFIEVDEQRTEAAAATGVTMLRATAAPGPRQVMEFHADHPFIYFIMDDASGTILFMGTQSSF